MLINFAMAFPAVFICSRHVRYLLEDDIYQTHRQSRRVQSLAEYLASSNEETAKWEWICY